MAFTYSYTTIADGSIDPDSPIDTALMTAIRNNIHFCYEYIGGQDFTPAEPHTHNGTNSALIATVADGGITEPKLGAGAVAQTKLKTAMGSVSTATGAQVLLTLPGGEYGFYPQISYYGGGAGASPAVATIGGNYWIDGVGNPATSFDSGSWGTTYLTRIVLMGDSDKGNQAQQRYVTASPPYDLGNGNIPTFVFLVVDNTTRRVEALAWAEDPPWANNGPTTINPLGRIVKLAQTTDKLKDVARLAGRRAAYFAALKAADDMLHSPDPTVQQQVIAIINAPITQAEKQRDMPLIPHPFTGNNFVGKSIVLLDPCGTTVEELWLAQTYGGDDINDIIHGGHLDIDNTPCGANSPPGVMAVGCRWKNTP